MVTGVEKLIGRKVNPYSNLVDFLFRFMCFRDLEQKLTQACGFIGVRPPNDCKSEPIDTPCWSLLKPETLQPLPWKWEGPRSVSLTMPRKMQTSYHADLVPAKDL
ncbi:unnamed protein product [Malus baccata var. baccata]